MLKLHVVSGDDSYSAWGDINSGDETEHPKYFLVNLMKKDRGTVHSSLYFIAVSATYIVMAASVTE